MVITIPPLRARRDDLPLLVRHFLGKYGRAFGKGAMSVSSEVLDVLSQYPFPGNVRELENIIERAVALSDGEEISLRDLPSDLRELTMRNIEPHRMVPLATKEKEYIREVLRRTRSNKGQAADILGPSRTTLWRKMKHYGLE